MLLRSIEVRNPQPESAAQPGLSVVLIKIALIANGSVTRRSAATPRIPQCGALPGWFPSRSPKSSAVKGTVPDAEAEKCWCPARPGPAWTSRPESADGLVGFMAAA